MKFKIFSLLNVYFLGLFISFPALASNEIVGLASQGVKKDTVRLENPFTVEYFKKHIRKGTPKLLITPSMAKQLRMKVKTDPVVRNYYKAIKFNAKQILKKPLLRRKLIGKRLLHVSRKMLYRMNVLGITYLIDKDPEILDRINKEIKDVCHFKDWHPPHFLDVAEMSMAVAIAIDWTGGDLPKSTIELAKKSLIDKGIKPSYEKKYTWWLTADNNWNEVCNAGMIAASIVVTDINPKLAAKTIKRSLNSLPHELGQYAPDGAYPEGPTYWGYGTTYAVLAASMLKSSFGSDFGISEVPGFMRSATYVLEALGPSGKYYNYFDAGLKPSKSGIPALAWFAAKTGNKAYYQKGNYLKSPEILGKLNRFAGTELIWLSQFKEKKVDEPPLIWKADGPNPVVFFRGGKDDPHHFYLGAKGGRGSLNHGNMDAGSFIFELNGVRWVLDPGTQSYHDLEKTGFDLWCRDQDCQRWTLLTKNNFGHSTLTINHALFNVGGYVPIIDFKKGDQPVVTFDMSELYFGNLKHATRRFVKVNNHTLLMVDKFETTPSTKMITWQLMTTADVEFVTGGAILHEDGKQLKVEILSPSDMSFSVVSLDPPPLKLDKRIKNLKRLELRIPTWFFENGEGVIKVRLSGD